MKKLLLPFCVLAIISCGSDNADSNGVIPLHPEKESADSTEQNSSVSQEDDNGGVFDQYLNVLLDDGTDTSMVFERIPFDRFKRFRYRKLMLEKRDEYWVITHPDYEYKMAEIAFVPELNEFTYTGPDSTTIELINKHHFYGTGGEMPETEFSRFTFLPVGGDVKNIPEDVTQELYNINLRNPGRDGNPQAYRLMDGGMIMVLEGGAEGYEYMAMFLFDKDGELINKKIEYLPQPEDELIEEK